MAYSKKWFLVLVVFFFSASLAFAYGQLELDRAKRAMNNGDYRYALQMFRDISTNYNYSRIVQREAAYYIGFCYVKRQDPWNAITAYENFLDRFDNSDGRQFIPDAMYVLGRTYEEVREIQKAVRIYRRCIDRFPGNEFADKSRIQLRKLGHGGGGDDGHGGNDGHCDISPEVYDMIRLAKLSNNSYTADQMLLRATRKARNGIDFVAISREIQNDFTRGQVFEACQSSTVFRRMAIRDILALAKTSNNGYTQDQLLLAAARKRAQTANEFSRLAEATSNAFTRQQILKIAEDKLGYGGPHYSMQAGTAGVAAMVDTPTAKKDSEKKPLESDPFRDFSIDKNKISRINQFLDAVKTKKNIDSAYKALSKDDMDIETVQKSVQEYSQIKKFQKLHQNEK